MTLSSHLNSNWKFVIYTVYMYIYLYIFKSKYLFLLKLYIYIFFSTLPIYVQFWPCDVWIFLSLFFFLPLNASSITKCSVVATSFKLSSPHRIALPVSVGVKPKDSAVRVQVVNGCELPQPTSTAGRYEDKTRRWNKLKNTNTKYGSIPLSY